MATLNQEPGPDVIGRAAYAQWLGWPDRWGTRWPALRGIVGDGYFLLTVPLLAVVLPLVAMISGFVVGFGHLGYDEVYTESLPLMVVMIALGAFSTQLGTLAVLGFAIGDALFLFTTDDLTGGAFRIPSNPSFTDVVVDQLLPLLISYLLLGTAVIVLPRAARLVTAAVGRGRRIPIAVVWPLTGALVLLILWIGVGAWAAAGPTLIRPIFVWPGGVPTVEAIAPLQQDTGWLVAASIIGAMLRHLWIGITMVPGPWRDRISYAESLPSGSRPATADRNQAPGWVRLVLGDIVFAALATLTMAGILEVTWAWIVTFLVLLTVRVLRSPLIRVPGLDWWKRVMAWAPSWIRLIVIWLVGRLLVDAVSQDLFTTYTGLAMFVVGAVLVAFVVFPGQPSAPRERTGQ